MAVNETTTAESTGAEIPCPQCHQRAADVHAGDGVLEFRCNSCGHQWFLFDRAPQEAQEGSER